MATNVATLTAKMAFDVSNFQRGVGLVVAGVGKVEGGIGTLTAAFASGAAGGLAFAGATKIISAGLNVLTTAANEAIEAISFGAKLAAEAELAEVGFGVMIGSAKRAKQLMKELETFAIQTPFSMSGLQEATKTLLGSGFSETSKNYSILFWCSVRFKPEASSRLTTSVKSPRPESTCGKRLLVKWAWRLPTSIKQWSGGKSHLTSSATP
jgi:hypothetical protein